MELNFEAQLPTDKTIIVYCYTGQTASQTTAILRLLGYDAYNLSGGMGKEGGSGWLGAGYPVVTD
jgi:rhodanese-related sulfurtransferase